MEKEKRTNVITRLVDQIKHRNGKRRLFGRKYSAQAKLEDSKGLSPFAKVKQEVQTKSI